MLPSSIGVVGVEIIELLFQSINQLQSVSALEQENETEENIAHTSLAPQPEASLHCPNAMWHRASPHGELQPP